MQSKRLKQQVRLELDALGMQGPVTRRAVAEAVLARTNEKHWSVRDRRNADIAYIMDLVTSEMNRPHGAHLIEQFGGSIPRRFQRKLEKLPRFICISPRGGRGARHVYSLRATTRHWEMNFELKDAIASSIAVKREEAGDFMRWLRAEGAGCIEDILAGADEHQFSDPSIIQTQTRQPSPTQPAE